MARRDEGDAGRPQRKRKVSYYQRKDEIEALREQVAALEDELRRVKPVPMAIEDGSAAATTMDALNAAFQQDIERNNLVLAGTQSLLSSYYATPTATLASIPLHTFMHLPREESARREMIRAMRGPKLEQALRFILERTRFLDLQRRHRHTEHFDLPNGDMVCTGLEIIQFKGGHTTRQVFDEFLFYEANQEITVSEKLGILTVRESEEYTRFDVGQLRMVTTLPDGLEMESNELMCTTFVEPPQGSAGYGLITLDFVDVDDLHPYRSETRGQKHVTVVILINEVSTPVGRVVAMSKWFYLRFRPPTAPVTESSATTAFENVTKWCSVMPTVIAERLAFRPVS